MRYGGSFSPPLTDEKLASYEAMIASLPIRSPVRDSMVKLLHCCKLWWELPDSVGTPTRPHPVGERVGANGEVRPAPTIVELEKRHQEALWDAIPWGGGKDADGNALPDELGEMARLFDGIEVDACERNSRKIEAWQTAVAEAIREEHFPVSAANRTAFNKLMKLSWETFTSVMKELGLMDDNQELLLQKHRDAANACNAATTQAFISKTHSTIPYPTLEPAPLRDAAHHLLWYARELLLDREPLTANML